MKIVIAPDSFKESLSAREVAEEIAAGFKQIFPDADYVLLPVADGGEGTVQAMIAATSGSLQTVAVRGPRGESVQAAYGLSASLDLAIIEMASASGLELVPPAQRNPLVTTSYGTGELIRDALARSARHIVIGLGGSATNDGGAGMLQALGVHLLDADGRELGQGGEELARLAHIDASGLDPRIETCRIDVACDVSNPLTGPRGASKVFGPQKGATPEMVETLDRCLAHFAEVLARDLGQHVAAVPGAGAAGGMGAALLGVLGAHLRPGSEVVTEAVGLAAALAGADLVITGEGRIDSQTICGKTPIGVADVARRQGVPVIGLAGSLAQDAGVVHERGIDAIFSAVPEACSLDEALRSARANLRSLARNVAAAIRIGLSFSAR